MPSTDLNRAASDAPAFRQFHQGTLVLPNAWDAMSAAVIAEAGAKAIATSSGGVSWSRGVPDGQHLTCDQAVELAQRIISVVTIPVSIDIEAGYGGAPSSVAVTVERFLSVGACGVNLEDAPGPVDGLFSVDDQCRRIEAARTAASRVGIDAFINARTDVYLSGTKSLDDAIARGNRYAQAGADGLFVPGVADLDIIATLVAASTIPVNIMMGIGGPTVAQLCAVGVRRISVGVALARLAYSAADRAARELLSDGSLSSAEATLDGKTLNQLVL
jgi:2-methylisocitrate lyase-like PEP mutase family enzyme